MAVFTRCSGSRVERMPTISRADFVTPPPLAGPLRYSDSTSLADPGGLAKAVGSADYPDPHLAGLRRIGRQFAPEDGIDAD